MKLEVADKDSIGEVSVLPKKPPRKKKYKAGDWEINLPPYTGVLYCARQ